MRLLAALAFLLAVGVVSAADWPMRGGSSSRNAVSLEKGAPTDWQVKIEDEEPRNIKWSSRLLTGYHAIGGPVVANGLVWVGTAEYDRDKKIDNAALVCFRASDGKLLHTFAFPRLKFPDDWSGQSLSGAPLVEGDRLYLCNNRREVICFDVEPLRTGTGKPREVWKLDMVKTLKIHARSVMIPGCDDHGSPTAYKDWLYVPTGNGVSEDGSTVPAPDAPSLVCLRKDTGKVVWSDNSPGKVMQFGHCASALVVEIGGRGQVIHPQADGWVRSFDAETGKLLWKFDTNRKGVVGDFHDENGPRAPVVAPVYVGGRVYFAHGHTPEACYGPGRLFCVDPTKTGDVSPELDDGKGKGKPNPNSALVWDFEKAGPKDVDQMHLSLSPVAVLDGLVIATDFSGIVHCLDEKTGKRHWAHDTKGQVYGGPLIADGKSTSGRAWAKSGCSS